MSNGIETRTSRHSVHDTVERLKRILIEKGIKLFCIVDHSGEAKSAGLTMPETKLLIFGNPKAGTPVMLAAPDAALDLPLKILVAEHATGEVTVQWNDAAWLRQRHGFSEDLAANLAAAALIAENAAS